MSERTSKIGQLEAMEKELQQTLSNELIKARESADEKLRIWKEGQDG